MGCLFRQIEGMLFVLGGERMHRFVRNLAAGMALASLAGLGALHAGEVPAKPAAKPLLPPALDKPETCGSHGTSVVFLDTPSDAAAKAKKEQKLVFVLHVS